MNLPPSRAEILAALHDATPSALGSRLMDAVTAYCRAFDKEAHCEIIRLPAPTDEVEAVALELFLDEMRAHTPSAAITIKGDN
jgi:hypothetical protein